MKRINLITIVSIASVFFFTANTLSIAQVQKPAVVAPQADFHSHTGFHIEMALGPAFGTITDKVTQYGTAYNFDFSGTGVDFELKLGGALQENFDLTFDILSKVISAPEVSNGVQTAATSNDLS